MKIVLIQTTLHWHQPQANRDAFEDRFEHVTKADLVVLPEMFTTGFTMSSAAQGEPMTGPTVEWLHSQANKHQFAICGSFICEQDGHFFNRFILVKPDDTEAISYDKRHLFRMANEHQHFESGENRVVFELNGFRICPQICYDLRFPVFSRNQEDYDLLLYVANWPAARSAHWRTLLTARAIENQSFVIGLNRIGTDGNDIAYAGDSGLVHPNGNWLHDLQNHDTAESITIDKAELEGFKSNFPAWRDADAFNLV